MVIKLVLCDPSNQNLQNITCILLKNMIIKLRLIYGTNVDKITKKQKCGQFFFFAEKKKLENVLLERYVGHHMFHLKKKV